MGCCRTVRGPEKKGRVWEELVGRDRVTMLLVQIVGGVLLEDSLTLFWLQAVILVSSPPWSPGTSAVGQSLPVSKTAFPGLVLGLPAKSTRRVTVFFLTIMFLPQQTSSAGTLG